MFQSAAGSITFTFHPPLDTPGPSRSYRQKFPLLSLCLPQVVVVAVHKGKRRSS